MSLVRYQKPFLPAGFSGLLNNFFEDSLPMNNGEAFHPKVSISEDEKAFSVNAELPGVKKDDIHVDLSENTLTISGERKHKSEKKEENFHLVESTFGKFTRSFHLPKNVDQANIDAKYEDGILYLTIPKKKQEELSTKIKIK